MSEEKDAKIQELEAEIRSTFAAEKLRLLCRMLPAPVMPEIVTPIKSPPFRLLFRPLFYHKFPLKTTSLLLSGEKVTQKHFHTAAPSVQRYESALRP